MKNEKKERYKKNDIKVKLTLPFSFFLNFLSLSPV